MTRIRMALGVLTTVAFLGLGGQMLGVEPRIGALLLAFGMLRGTLVGRQIYTEWSQAQPTDPGPG